MSIRPMDTHNIYLRMGEVSREQDKEIKKEGRQQDSQKRIQRFREENFDRAVNQVLESHADKTVKEHEDRGLPKQKKNKDDNEFSNGYQGQHQEQQKQHDTYSAQDIALPMVTLHQHAYGSRSLNLTTCLDPDLGQYVNIIS